MMVEKGKLVYKESGVVVHTDTGKKGGEIQWMFVLSSSSSMFVGKKEKGQFQHSSFLSGAATLASGCLLVYQGTLQVIYLLN